MPRFSVTLVTRNEAPTLPRLVQSLEMFRCAGGAIFVLDTGSDDDTLAVARKFGCVVAEAGDRFSSRLSETDAARIQAHFACDGEGPIVTAGQRLFDFAAARQHAGERAARDFVWQLDGSDEVLVLDVGAIDRRIAEGSVGGFGFRLRVGGGSLEARRFYDRRVYHWQGRTHEGLYARPQAPGAAPPPPTVGCPDTEILVVHHREEKERNYLAGLALDALAAPGMPRWQHYVGRELFYGRWYRSAVRVLEHHAQMPGAAPADQVASLCLAAECLERLGDRPAAEAALEGATLHALGIREPWLRLAALRSQRGDFTGAAECGERALAIRTRSRAPERDANYTWLPHALLYWSLFWLGRHDEARRHWEACRSLAPADERVREHGRLFAVRPGTESDIVSPIGSR
jgi:tetratricopeptide (TPR) repeat protein